MSQTQETVAATEAEVVTKQKGGKKAAATGNFIFDTAQQIESLTKPKALNLAAELASDIDANSFRLGGVLKVIKDNAWFEGAENFGDYVSQHFGFQKRKAEYLIEIYDHLVQKQIDWSKVSKLGWTKLKELAKILTQENTDEWVAKAEKLTVLELVNVLKGNTASASTAGSTIADHTTTLKFKFKPDQVATVQSALAKAKGELGTEYDTVALENIAAGYLGGAIAATAPAAAPEVDPATLFQSLGWQKVLEIFGTVFPAVDLTVTSTGE
jgi:hypothetical protein